MKDLIKHILKWLPQKMWSWYASTKQLGVVSMEEVGACKSKEIKVRRIIKAH
jgi:hypothetical protein